MPDSVRGHLPALKQRQEKLGNSLGRDEIGIITQKTALSTDGGQSVQSASTMPCMPSILNKLQLFLFEDQAALSSLISKSQPHAHKCMRFLVSLSMFWWMKPGHGYGRSLITQNHRPDALVLIKKPQTRLHSLFLQCRMHLLIKRNLISTLAIQL